MPENAAAWIRAKHARLTVAPSRYPAPGPHHVVIRARAVAVNPLEWIIQIDGSTTHRWLRYPTILGSDVAGEVVEIGAAVTRFRVGDRVLAHAVGTDEDSNDGEEGAYQRFVKVLDRMTSPIPPDLDFVAASTLPLAVSTASAALFEKDQLGLELPTGTASPRDGTVLIWGGATSVGSQAIQLATAAGYDVVSTASPRNFEHARALGARAVLDYRSPDVEQDVIAAIGSRRFAGAVALGTTSAPSCVRIAGKVRGRRRVAMGTPPVDLGRLAHGRPLDRVRVVTALVGRVTPLLLSARLHGVRARFIFGSSIKHTAVSSAIYGEYLPAALAKHRYRIAPAPTIAGRGLADVQKALDLQRRGVSATKLVVTID